MQRTAEDLAGHWQVTRTITDHLVGQSGRFDGQARLVPVPGGLDYAEEGVLRLGDGLPLTASRAYQWCFVGDTVEVRFADGRPFHAFAPGKTGPGTDHYCGADLYRVRYDWDRWPDWVALWDVRGPRKDYRMESRYTRATTHALASGGGIGQDLS